jgi:DNA-binding beta-propeller fold protein YncE
MRRPCAIACLVAAAAIAGCGSLEDDELPPPVGPAASAPVRAAEGTLLVQLDGRRRALDVFDARTRRRVGSASAGVGPTQVACRRDGEWCWVTDARGDALLVFDLHDGDPELTRRVYLPGRPDAIRVDRERYRLVVRLAARDEVVELPSHGRPHVVARRPARTGRADPR